MLKIRLTRIGRKGQPLYRLVLAEHARPVKGKFIEILGVYDPRGKQGEPKLEVERLKYWISQGAQLSPRVAGILKQAGAVSGEEKTVAQALKELARKKAAKKKPKGEESKAEGEKQGSEKPAPSEIEAKDQPEAKPTKEPAKEEEKKDPKPEPAVKISDKKE